MECSSYSRNTCRLRGSSDVSVFLPLAASPIADAYVPKEKLEQSQPLFPMDVWICLNCGHVQLLDVVNPDHIYREYLYITHSSPGLVDYYREYAHQMAAFASLAKSDLVIDIGSNDGALLSTFQRLGMRVLGIDPARKIAAKATREGIPTIPEFLTPELAAHIRQTHGPAQMVTANNIAANVDDVRSLFESVEILLADKGLFVLESGYWFDIVNNMLFDTIYHEHLSYFSILPLQQFVKSTPFTMVHALHTPSKGGCLRYVFAKRQTSRPVSSQLESMAESESRFGLNTLRTNLAYAERVAQCRCDVRTHLARLRDEGKNIAAYGASNTTTTLFYYFGLAEYIPYIVDDNPIKIGSYSPGLHLPVLSPAVIYERKPDCIFIAAWRFANLIIERHPQYADIGGQWFIPLPEVTLL